MQFSSIKCLIEGIVYVITMLGLYAMVKFEMIFEMMKKPKEPEDKLVWAIVGLITFLWYTVLFAYPLFGFGFGALIGFVFALIVRTPQSNDTLLKRIRDVILITLLIACVGYIMMSLVILSMHFDPKPHDDA